MTPAEPPYQQTDLDLWATFNLQPLCDALATRGLFVLSVDPIPSHDVLPDGGWKAILERDDDPDGPPDHPAETIGDLLAAVEGLPADARHLWDACERRTLDIGLNSKTKPGNWQSPLPADLIRRAAAAGLGVGLTLYGPFDEEPPGG